MAVKRVSRRDVDAAIRRGGWQGYITGGTVTADKVEPFSDLVTITSLNELRRAVEAERVNFDPETGYRVAYWEPLAHTS